MNYSYRSVYFIVILIVLFLAFQMHPKRKSTSYTNDDLYAAVAEVQNGKKNRETAKKYSIPYTTLDDKVNGRVPISLQKSGPSSYLL